MIPIRPPLSRPLASLLLFCGIAAAQAPHLIGTFPVAAFPTGNPTSASGLDPVAAPQREALGKVLFWDEQLSNDRTVACGTCHAMHRGGTDDHAGLRHPGFDGVLGNANDTFGSPGVVRQDVADDYTSDPVFGVDKQGTPLKAPTMIGAAFFRRLFWDKRAGPDFKDLTGVTIPGFNDNAALEAQASGPPANSVEMGHDGIQWLAVEQKLGALTPLALASNIPATFPNTAGQTYQNLFDAAFGPGPITRTKVAMVLASYMRTLIPDQAPVVAGTMTAAQIRGLNLFRTRGCAFCHSSGQAIEGTFNPTTLQQTFTDPNDRLFSDGRAHNVQLDNHTTFPATFPNDGFGIGVKTPTLLNVGLHKTLFHSGQFTSLAQAMTNQFNDPATPAAFRFNPLLTTQQQINDVLDFMQNALTDPRVASAQFPFDQPTLRADVVPFGANLTGPGSPGTGGLVPAMIANAPPKLGNTAFKFGVGRAKPGAAAQLWFAPTLAPGQVINGVPFELHRGTAQLLNTLTVSAAGTATVHRPIGTSPALLGVQVHYQWLVVDAAAAGGLAASPAASFTLF